ncbi:MAG: hypothetical protein ACK5U4_05385 [Rhodospirillales bacterium]
MRKAHRHHRSGSRGVARCAARNPCRRGFHDPPPPAVAEGDRDCGVGADWRIARRPGRVQLFQCRSREHPQPQGHWRRGLLDIGCYALMSGRLLFGADPMRATAIIERSAAFGTDTLSSGLFEFGAGRHLGFSVSTQLVPFQRVQALGTKGRIEIEIPFNPPPDAATRIFVDDGTRLGGRNAREIAFPPVDQYQLQAEAFGRTVRGLAPVVGGIEDAILNMRALDALARAGDSGRWEVV